MSFSELLFLSVLALLVFGPKRLPEIARLFGKTMAELRKASADFKRSLEDEVRNLELQEDSNKRAALAEVPPEPIYNRGDYTIGPPDHGEEVPPSGFGEHVYDDSYRGGAAHADIAEGLATAELTDAEPGATPAGRADLSATTMVPADLVEVPDPELYSPGPGPDSEPVTATWRTYRPAPPDR